MLITYANQKVEKYFTDYIKMQQKLPFEWVKAIKKQILYFKSSATFAEYLKLGLGKPHPLINREGFYGIHITPNIRLVVKPNLENNSIEICQELEIEGVCDYHGNKENWYIP